MSNKENLEHNTEASDIVTEMLRYNKQFVKNEKYKLYKTTKYPNKKVAVLSCMDTRLTELLPAALNFRNGDIKIIKTAGAVISHPFGSVMRSILIAIYVLHVEEIMVIGHHSCGMQGLDQSKLIGEMLKRGITQEKIDMAHYYGVDIHKWLQGFESAESSVLEAVNVIKNHPFMPKDVIIYGFLMDPETGELTTL